MPELFKQFVIQTPVWLGAVLAYLVFRDVTAPRPAKTSLLKLAIIPAIFTAWGLADLTRPYGLKTEATGLGLAGIAMGAIIGWRLLDHADIGAGQAAKVINRPADRTLLPLLFVTFASTYIFAAAMAIDPALGTQPSFAFCDLALSGGLTGIFAGKFYSYYRAHKMLLTRPVIPG